MTIDPRDWDALHDAARQNLGIFTRLAWPELNRGTPLIWSWHNDAICEHLQAITEGQIQKLIICVPPGSSKTTHAAQAWPAWEWLRYPHFRWGFASYSMELSTRDSVKRRNLITSDWYRQAFSPPWNIQADQSLKTLFANTATGEMRAASVGGAATGFHYDRLGTDDGLKAMDIYTVKLEQATVWYEEQWATRLRDPNKSAELLINQRLHDRDIAGIKEKDKRWVVLRISMEYEKKYHCVTRIGWEDPRKTDGEPLCPERFGPDFIAEKKRNPRVWAAQYQQRPQVGDGTIYRMQWFRFYYVDQPIDGAVPYPGDEAMEKWVGSWDFTFDGGAKADYNTGGVWARKGAFVYLRDQTHAQMRFTEQRRAAMRLARKWPQVRRWLMENKANGAAIIDSLRRPMESEDGDDAEGLPGVIAVDPKESKIARAEAVATYFQAGNVLLPHPSMPGYEWVTPYMDELCAFPTGAHDDQVDQTSQALKDLFRRSTVTAADYNDILPTAGGLPGPDDTPDNITDPRRFNVAEAAFKEALAEERQKQAERDQIAARLGLDLVPGAPFSTRFGR